MCAVIEAHPPCLSDMTLSVKHLYKQPVARSMILSGRQAHLLLGPPIPSAHCASRQPVLGCKDMMTKCALSANVLRVLRTAQCSQSCHKPSQRRSAAWRDSVRQDAVLWMAQHPWLLRRRGEGSGARGRQGAAAGRGRAVRLPQPQLIPVQERGPAALCCERSPLPCVASLAKARSKCLR